METGPSTTGESPSDCGDFDPRQSSPVDDLNEVHQVHLPLEDFYFGVKLKTTLTALVKCPSPECSGRENLPRIGLQCDACFGRGVWTKLVDVTETRKPCSKCEGTGTIGTERIVCVLCGDQNLVRKHFAYSLDVPRGVRNGYPITFEGRAAGKTGKTRGDLVFVCVEQPDDELRRHESDLFTVKTVGVVEALFGIQFSIRHPDGTRLYVKTDRAVFPGMIMRLKGAGFCSGSYPYIHGDLYVKFVVEMPGARLEGDSKEAPADMVTNFPTMPTMPQPLPEDENVLMCVDPKSIAKRWNDDQGAVGGEKKSKGSPCDSTIVLHHRFPLQAFYNGIEETLILMTSETCSDCGGQGGPATRFLRCEDCEGQPGHVFVSLDHVELRQGCRTCHNAGRMIPDKLRCKSCGGKGVIETKKQLQAKLHKGAPNGHILVFENELPKKLGPSASDVNIVCDQVPHEVFTRHGSDLLMDKEITLEQALNGARFSIDHPDGSCRFVSTNRKQVISHDMVLYLPGQGMPVFNNPGDYGDLFVRFKIKMPTQPSILDVLPWIRKVGLDVPRVPTLETDTVYKSLELVDADLVNQSCFPKAQVEQQGRSL